VALRAAQVRIAGRDRGFHCRTGVYRPIAAYQFEARSLRANMFLYADVLALLTAYAGVLPPALQLTAGDISSMWGTVLTELPADA